MELCEYETGGGSSSTSNLGSTKQNKATSFLGSGGGEEKKEMTTSSIDDDEDNEERVVTQQQDESEMRGIHAKQHVPPNTICMSIPRRCLITVEMGQATSIGQAIYHSDLDLDAPKHIYLMIYILWDRKVHGDNSFFAPYYATLPKTLNNMPIFWSPEELAELQGSYLLHQIADRNQAIAEDYHTICAVAPSLRQICTLNEFKWARMCVCSRNFGLQIDGHRTSALVPHADMLNHYRPRETKWTFDEEQNAFTITTLQHIPAGAQVYDSYGQKCNHRFLLNYGFAVEENRELDGFCPNEVPLELGVDPNDPTYAEKVEFWTRGEVGYHHHQQQPPPSIQNMSNMPSMASSATATTSPQFGSSQQATTSHKSRFGGPGRASRIFASGAKANSSSSAQSDLVAAQQAPHSGSSSLSSTASMTSSAHSNILKRVRVCVSNNENTRLLFSLLRALACNEAELRAIRAPISSSSFGVHNPTNSHHDASSPSRTSAMFGFSSAHPQQFHHQHYQQQQAHYQYNHILSGTPTALLTGATPSVSSTSASFFRSCRDIRHPVSLRNERAALRLLLDLVGEHLSRYPTTLAQDVADLADEQAYPRFSNRRHAKIQVKGEKEVLHHFALWAKTGMDVLQVMEQDLTAIEQQWNEQQTQVSPSSSSSSYGHNGGVEVKLTRSGQTVMDESSLCSSTSRAGLGGSTANAMWNPPPLRTDNFDALIRRMEDESNGMASPVSASLSIGNTRNSHHHHATVEEDEEEDDASSGGGNELHHTILRYCADVLGSLMREEVKNLKQRLRWRASPSTIATATINNQTPASITTMSNHRGRPDKTRAKTGRS